MKVIDDQTNAQTAINMGGFIMQSGNSGTHGDFLVDNIVISDTAIPEPTTLILLVIGLLTAAATVRARRRK